MDRFTHVRIIMGMIVSLGLTHMLKGVSSVIQHPSRHNFYPIHMAWVLSVILNILQFWWWEFSLSELPHWTVGIYLFLIFYAFLIYLLCSMLFPDSIREYRNYREYFMSRRVWFFGLLLIGSIADVADSLIKGSLHVEHLGYSYWFETGAVAVACLIAMRTRNQIFHATFVTANLIVQVVFFVQLYWSGD